MKFASATIETTENLPPPISPISCQIPYPKMLVFVLVTFWVVVMKFLRSRGFALISSSHDGGLPARRVSRSSSHSGLWVKVRLPEAGRPEPHFGDGLKKDLSWLVVWHNSCSIVVARDQGRYPSPVFVLVRIGTGWFGLSSDHFAMR